MTTMNYSGSEELLTSGDAYFSHLIATTRAAAKSIDIQCYIFADDTRGREFTEVLCQCAMRGVRIRLLVDGFGSYTSIDYLDALCRSAGIEFRVYHRIKIWPLIASILVPSKNMPMALLARRANRRNHRKCFIIDDQRALIGSMNITNSAPQLGQAAAHFLDTGVAITGDGLPDLVNDFNYLWSSAGKPTLSVPFLGYQHPPRQHTPEQILLNTTFLQRRRVQGRIIKQLDQAQREILIANAYVVPNHRSIRALTKAAERGVVVLLMVSARSDVAFMAHVATAFYARLLAKGVRIFQYHAGILHRKTMLIDDWAIVGSSNLNHRSLLHDLEVDVVLTEADCRRQLRESFIDDLSSCTEITPQELHRRPWWEHLVGVVGYHLRHWL